MENNSQVIFGVGNSTNIFYNENKKIYDNISNHFKNYDTSVNELFPQGIEYSKLKDEKGQFKSSKIFSSLVKIDIPLEDALYIVENVVITLIEKARQNNYAEGLSTHEIRKVVASTILNYPRENITNEEAEKWADKYVRKYGHDAQRVEIYFESGEGNVNVNFDFIKDRLLNDIFIELKIRNEAFGRGIPSRQISSISREIIEFINDCNMYKINYNILKEFIIEMALQPPHPWFVTEKTAKEISEYDLNVLKKHYLKLKNAKKDNCFENLYYTIYEALHHSCSSILARYNQVLGCKDLDVFYNLESIVTLLNNKNETNLLMEMNEIGNLPNDLKFISRELSGFLGLLRRIKGRLTIGKIVSSLNEEYVTDVIELCDIAFALGKDVSIEELEEFINSNWKDSPKNETREYIKKVFEIINGLKVTNFLSKKPNCFWVKRESCKTEKEVFVICMDSDIQFSSIITFYKQNKTILNTEAIFLIIENENDKEQYNNVIEELYNERYFIEIVYKKDLQKILKSNNKYREFCKILKRDLYS